MEIPSGKVKQQLQLLIVAAGIAAIGAACGGSSVFASHSFEAGVKGDSIPDNAPIMFYW